MLTLDKFTSICKEIFFSGCPEKENFLNYEYMYDHIGQEFATMIDYIDELKEHHSSSNELFLKIS